MVYFFTLILAACSVIYELLLGQILSAFLGNTVLRYTVTIGLYMLSMGIGAFLVTEPIRQRPIVSLQRVELALSLLGSCSLPLLFVVDYLGAPDLIFSLLAHSFIIIIGVLTGMEIPLLIALKGTQQKDQEASVLGVDYIGAFLGTLLFAFYLYPVAGLTMTSFSIASLNAFIGVLLLQEHDLVALQDRPLFNRLLQTQGLLLVVLLFGCYHAATLELFFINLYIDAAL